MKEKTIRKIRKAFRLNWRKFDVKAHIERVIKMGLTEKERRLDKARRDSQWMSDTTIFR